VLSSYSGSDGGAFGCSLISRPDSPDFASCVVLVRLVAERLDALAGVGVIDEAVWALGEGVLSDGTDAMILGRCHGHITGRQESQHTRRDTALHHLVLVVADQEDGGRRIRDELAGIREAGTKGKAGTHKERSGSDELEDGWMDGWKDR